MVDELVGATIRHRMSGRTRIVVDATARSDDVMVQLAEALAALPGVESTDTRPLSGSIVIRHKGVLGDETLSSAGLALRPAPAPEAVMGDPIRTATDRLARLNKAVKSGTDGKLDLWGLAFGGLLATGIIQLVRGRVAGPALTIFGQAATLVLARPLNTFLP
jgi:hypothetical protein